MLFIIPGRLVLADLKFEKAPLYYLPFGTPINKGLWRLIYTIIQVTHPSDSWRRSEISAPIISAPIISPYFGNSPYLGFHLGIRVFWCSSWYKGLTEIHCISCYLCEGSSLYLLNIYREVCWVFFPKRVSQGKSVFCGFVTLILLCYWIFVECKKFLAIKHN